MGACPHCHPLAMTTLKTPTWTRYISLPFIGMTLQNQFWPTRIRYISMSIIGMTLKNQFLTHMNTIYVYTYHWYESTEPILTHMNTTCNYIRHWYDSTELFWTHMTLVWLHITNFRSKRTPYVSTPVFGMTLQNNFFFIFVITTYIYARHWYDSTIPMFNP